MDATYFHKQDATPLFDELLWSRPQNRRQAGKLLIIGGNLHGFAAAALAYQTAQKAGVGSSRIMLPSALQKTVGKLLQDGQFAPSTPSGSFSKLALAEWLDAAAWADAILLAGDLGRNSETASTIENFCSKTNQKLIIAKDAVDYFYTDPVSLLMRPETTLVLSLAQLQKIAKRARWPQPLTFTMGQSQLAEWLHDFSSEFAANLMTYHNQQLLVAVGGRVSSTNVGEQTSWRVATAAQAAVWWLQNPSHGFEALTTAVHQTFKS
jgi:hypothetical protein